MYSLPLLGVTVEIPMEYVVGAASGLAAVAFFYLVYRIFTRFPRFGGLVLGTLAVAMGMGASYLNDTGELDALRKSTGECLSYLAMGTFAALSVWSFAMLVYGSEFTSREWRRTNRTGLISTVVMLSSVTALGAGVQFLSGLPTTLLFVNIVGYAGLAIGGLGMVHYVLLRRLIFDNDDGGM